MVAVDLDHAGLDPAVIYDITMRNIALMYEGLVTLKSGTTEIEPALAEKWEGVERYGFIIFIVLLITGILPAVLGFVIDLVFRFILT